MKRNKSTIIALFLLTCLMAKAETEADLLVIGEQVVDHLNLWCPDAFCAGDFHHTFLEFSYNSNEASWFLLFQSFPHDEDELLLHRPIKDNFSSRATVVLRSVCIFPSEDPLKMVTLETTIHDHVSGISPTMNDLLMQCVLKSEQKARTLFKI